MARPLGAAAVAVAVMLAPRIGAGEENSLTLDAALARARERAPAILSVRARIEEARGRLRGAQVLLRENPAIEALGGRRFSDHGDFLELDLGISQTFELGGRRSARIEGAEAAVAAQIADAQDATRKLLRDVGRAFVRALHAQERIRVMTANQGLMSELARAAQRRFEKGDIAVLDVNIARSAASRARAEVLASQAARENALGELRLLLGMPAEEALSIQGDLRDRRLYDLEALMTRAPERPDLRALQAETREAEAERHLGEGMRWPDLGLQAGYQREEGTNTVLGGMRLTLPVFSRGQEERAVGIARASRLRLEFEGTRRAVSVEIRTAFAAYQQEVAAVEELERNAIPAIDDNETLVRKSYEAGQISFPELLLIRRDSLDNRMAYLDRLLEAALAGIELEATAGVLR